MRRGRPDCSPACRCLVLLLLGLAAARGAKIHATLSYQVEGKPTVIGADGREGGWGLGTQLVSSLAMKDASSGAALGTMAAHCHVVSRGPGDGSWRALCTRHLDFADGSTMTAHSTETVGPANRPVSARMVVAGGIGRWEGAHGEDVAWSYDPAKGAGSGRILLNCLKGVC